MKQILVYNRVAAGTMKMNQNLPANQIQEQRRVPLYMEIIILGIHLSLPSAPSVSYLYQKRIHLSIGLRYCYKEILL